MTKATLESRHYVATEADAINFADQMFGAQSATDTVPRMYLRALVATTLHELKAPQRQRSGKVVKIDDAEQAQQLAALDAVIERLYPPLVARYKAKLGAAGRARELNSLTNWARGAHRDVRNWIRSGRDLRPLAAARLIKAMLAIPPTARAPTPSRVKARVERDSKAIVAAVMELAAVDKPGAIAEIRLLMGQLAGQLEELGVAATRDPKKAAAEHRPLHVGRSVFYPTESQVLRMAENPS